MSFETEVKFIKIFVEKNLRERFLEALPKDKKRRKLLSRLNHENILIETLRKKILPKDQNSEEIYRTLKNYGATDQCHIIGGGNLDKSDMNLVDALHEIVGFSAGTIVICEPGHLGYYEGEDPGERFIFLKK